jgi:hypothetical protein
MDLTAWAQMLAFGDHPARRWEPKRLRLCVFSAAARLVKGGRRLRLRLARHWRWADLIASAITRLQAGDPLTSAQPPRPPKKDTPTRDRGTPPTRRDSRARPLTRR